MFDVDKFSEILDIAKGGRDKKTYAEDSGVSRATISNSINKKLKNPPSPEILKRLAAAAHNGVTYEDLMRAAGHIQIDSKNPKVEDNKVVKQRKEVEKELDKVMEDLLATEGLMLNGEAATPEAMELLRSALRIGIEMAKKENRKYIPKKYRKEQGVQE